MSFDLTLTFDNGPEPDVTPGVLAALSARSILATFFVIGEKLARPGARALSERCRAEGHRIGNHTWTHSIPLGEQRGADVAEREIGRTQAIMNGLADGEKLFRPFGGGGNLDRRLLNPRVVAFLCAGGYSCVLWNSIPRDWAEPDAWVERAMSHCRQDTHTLMVLHDLPTGAMRHLPRFLDLVDRAGGRFRQDFPADCVPIRQGSVVAPIDAYVMV
jgi:peptidoglycan/xylan/chitin deacetylase (PgdA/CDA1 family)